MFIPIATCEEDQLSCSVEQVRPTLALYAHQIVCDIVFNAEFLPWKVQQTVVMAHWRSNPFRSWAHTLTP